MKKYKIEIEGVTPYLQHRMDDLKLEDWEKQRGRIIERDDISKEDLLRAEFHLYRNQKSGKCFMPSEHIRGSLINAGSFIKSKVGNAKKNMKNIVAGMFFVNPEEIILPESWIIDKRSAVNKNIKARIICIRPKWESWKVNFELWVDNDTITSETVKNLVEIAGQYVGIGSFRPEHNGMFGRFNLTKFEKL
jgi:hypothetical protein